MTNRTLAIIPIILSIAFIYWKKREHRKKYNNQILEIEALDYHTEAQGIRSPYFMERFPFSFIHSIEPTIMTLVGIIGILLAHILT